MAEVLELARGAVLDWPNVTAQQCTETGLPTTYCWQPFSGSSSVHRTRLSSAVDSSLACPGRGATWRRRFSDRFHGCRADIPAHNVDILRQVTTSVEAAALQVRPRRHVLLIGWWRRRLQRAVRPLCNIRIAWLYSRWVVCLGAHRVSRLEDVLEGNSVATHISVAHAGNAVRCDVRHRDHYV